MNPRGDVALDGGYSGVLLPKKGEDKGTLSALKQQASPLKFRTFPLSHTQIGGKPHGYIFVKRSSQTEIVEKDIQRT